MMTYTVKCGKQEKIKILLVKEGDIILSILSLVLTVLSMQISIAQAQVPQPVNNPVQVVDSSVESATNEVTQGVTPVSGLGKVQKKSNIRNSFLATTYEELGPVMKAVAWCESGGKHFKYGRIVQKNPVTPDYGLFQLNRSHFPEMKQLGLDPMIEADNIKFAMILYQRNGLADWSMSRSCWQGKIGWV